MRADDVESLCRMALHGDAARRWEQRRRGNLGEPMSSSQSSSSSSAAATARPLSNDYKEELFTCTPNRLSPPFPDSPSPPFGTGPDVQTKVAIHDRAMDRLEHKTVSVEDIQKEAKRMTVAQVANAAVTSRRTILKKKQKERELLLPPNPAIIALGNYL